MKGLLNDVSLLKLKVRALLGPSELKVNLRGLSTASPLVRYMISLLGEVSDFFVREAQGSPEKSVPGPRQWESVGRVSHEKSSEGQR